VLGRWDTLSLPSSQGLTTSVSIVSVRRRMSKRVTERVTARLCDELSRDCRRSIPLVDNPSLPVALPSLDALIITGSLPVGLSSTHLLLDATDDALASCPAAACSSVCAHFVLQYCGIRELARKSCLWLRCFNGSERGNKQPLVFCRRLRVQTRKSSTHKSIPVAALPKAMPSSSPVDHLCNCSDAWMFVLVTLPGKIGGANTSPPE